MNFFKSSPQTTGAQTSAAELVREKLKSGHHILPFPHSVGQLLNAIKDPNAKIESLSRIIEQDAALAVRLIRMANSPVYGCSNVIQSVARATTVLGIGKLRSMALTFAASSVFSGGNKVSGEKVLLWNHSLGCATMARVLAKSCGTTSPDDAFLAGIFHDVGKLFFYDVVPQAYCELAQGCSGQPLNKREDGLFGTTHEAVGFKLMNAWQLPEMLAVAVGFHHQPEKAIAHSELAKLIHVADAMARQAGIGSTADAAIDAFGKADEYFGLDAAALTQLLEQGIEGFEETVQACSS
jgi:HD-like signal output (HDOD) protein